MILLGLVGTPASGKSTVAEYLEGKGAQWINADLVARDTLNKTSVVRDLAKRFGDSILNSDGSINRKALAGLVFGTTPEKQQALDYLESVVHPPTRKKITEILNLAFHQSVRVSILDVPLLFESEWDRSCDAIWCIDAPLERRLEWATQRGWDKSELSRREANQMDIAKKRRLSNTFVFNDATLPELSKKLDLLWENLVTMESSGGVFNDQPHCFEE